MGKSYTVGEIKMYLLGLFTIISLVVVQTTEGTRSCEKSLEDRSQNVVTCAGCKVVISTLDAILTDPENELAIANALDEVCNYTVASFVEECHFMICKYYDVLIEALVSEFGNPDKVCG